MANIVGGAGVFSGPTRAEMEAANAANLAANLQTMRQRQAEADKAAWERLLKDPLIVEQGLENVMANNPAYIRSLAGDRLFAEMRQPGMLSQVRELFGAKPTGVGSGNQLGGTLEQMKNTLAAGYVTGKLGAATPTPAPAAPAAAIPVSMTKPTGGSSAPVVAVPEPAVAPAAPPTGSGPDQGVVTVPAGPSGASGAPAPATSADVGALYENWKARYLAVLGLSAKDLGPTEEAQLRNVFSTYADTSRMDEAFKGFALGKTDRDGLLVGVTDKSLAQAIRDNTPGAIRDPAGQAFVMAFNELTKPLAAAGVSSPADARATLGDSEASPEARGAASAVLGGGAAGAPAAAPAVGPALTADEVARVRALSPEQRKALAAGIRAANPTAPWGYKDDEPWDDRQMAELMRNNPGTIRSLLSSGFAPTGGAAGGTLVSAPGGATPATPTSSTTGRTDADRILAEGAITGEATGREGAAAKRELSSTVATAKAELRREWKATAKGEAANSEFWSSAAEAMQRLDPGGELSAHPALSRALLNFDKLEFDKGKAEIDRMVSETAYNRANADYLRARITSELAAAKAAALIRSSEAAQKVLATAKEVYEARFKPEIDRLVSKGFTGDVLEAELMKGKAYASFNKMMMDLLNVGGETGKFFTTAMSTDPQNWWEKLFGAPERPVGVNVDPLAGMGLPDLATTDTSLFAEYGSSYR